MARIESWFEQDLSRMVFPRNIGGRQFTKDNQGSLIGVKVYRDGQPVTLGGTVKGYCVLADGSTVEITGSKSGNAAQILMSAAALAVPGPISVCIKNIDGETVTLLAAEGTVYATGA